MWPLRWKRKVEELIINPSPRHKRRITSSVDWSELTRDVLVQIFENPTLSVDDFAMFSCVCRAWYYAAASCNLIKLRENWSNQIPWLMKTDGNYETWDEQCLCMNYGPRDIEGDKGDDSSYGIEEIEEVESVPHKLYPRKLWNFWNKYYKIDCPEGYRKVCWGSAYGWIVTSGLDHRMYMFNPLTKSRLRLPSRSTMSWLWYNEPTVVRHYFIHKAIVLNVPKTRHGDNGDDAETLMVVAVYDRGKAVIAKPGDTCWTEVKWEPGNLNASLFGQPDLMDAVYHNELGLVFVTQCGGLVQYDIWDEKQPPLLKWYCHEMSYIDDIINYTNRDCVTYIAKNGHDIFMVLRIRCLFEDEEVNSGNDANYGEFDSYKTFDFKVYVLDFCSKSWKELPELRDVIFLGNHATMYVRASNQFDLSNCICFTDDGGELCTWTRDKLGGHDFGIYRMEDKRFDWLCGGENVRSPYCCPFWFRPSL